MNSFLNWETWTKNWDWAVVLTRWANKKLINQENSPEWLIKKMEKIEKEIILTMYSCKNIPDLLYTFFIKYKQLVIDASPEKNPILWDFKNVIVFWEEWENNSLLANEIKKWSKLKKIERVIDMDEEKLKNYLEENDRQWLITKTNSLWFKALTSFYNDWYLDQNKESARLLIKIFASKIEELFLAEKNINTLSSTKIKAKLILELSKKLETSPKNAQEIIEQIKSLTNDIIDEASISNFPWNPELYYTNEWLLNSVAFWKYIDQLIESRKPFGIWKISLSRLLLDIEQFYWYDIRKQFLNDISNILVELHNTWNHQIKLSKIFIIDWWDIIIIKENKPVSGLSSEIITILKKLLKELYSDYKKIDFNKIKRKTSMVASWTSIWNIMNNIKTKI